MPQDILPHLGQRRRAAIVAVRDYPATANTFGSDLGPYRIGCPQRFELAAVNPGNVEDLVSHFAQRVQKRWSEDLAFGVFDDDAQHIALWAQHLFEAQVVLDIGVADGNHAREAGVGAERQAL